MEISKAAVGFLATVCIGAGAGGAYFATRPDVAGPGVAPPSAVAAAEDAIPVEQSEAVVSEEIPAPEPPTVASVPLPRAEAPPERPAPRRAARAPEPFARGPRPSEAPLEPAPAPQARIEAPLAFEPPVVIDDRVSQSLEPAGPLFDELVVSAESVIGLQLESTITSERARVEDEVVARVTRDVRVGDRVAIPAGARAHGEVTLVERGGRLKERARLGVRFTSIVLADGTRLPVETETIYREGDAPGGESAAKIGGGAIGGAILGGILGGAKGAAIGSAVGAGAGSGAVLAGGRNPATLSAGAPVTVRLEEPAIVTVER
jgi:hypothetical protein